MSGKVKKPSTSTKASMEQKDILLNFSPKELLQDVKEVILQFRDMNPALTKSVARKLQRNLNYQRLNAEAYVKKEKDLVTEYIQMRKGVPLLWNGKTTEKVYETIEGTEEKRLAGGKFEIKDTPQGPILVNEDNEQYFPASGEKVKYLQKDIEKEAEYTEKLQTIQSTPIEVRVVLFEDEELEELNIPSDPTFLNIFVDGIK